MTLSGVPIKTEAVRGADEYPIILLAFIVSELMVWDTNAPGALAKMRSAMKRMIRCLCLFTTAIGLMIHMWAPLRASLTAFWLWL